jgi:hypothetical protein
VVDSPDVFSMGFAKEEACRRFEEWKRHAPNAAHTVFVLVVRMDVRFTPDDTQLYDDYLALIPPELRQCVILAFTNTEKLKQSLKEEIQTSPVQGLCQKAAEAFVAFSTNDSVQQCQQNKKNILKIAHKQVQAQKSQM